MATWKPTRHLSWIVPLVIIPNLVVGVWLIYMSASIPEQIRGALRIISLQQEIFLMGLVFIFSPPLGFLWTHFSLGRANRTAERLVRDGLRGRARLLDYEETGKILNDNSELELRWEIFLSGRDSYEVRQKDYVSQLFLGKLRTGLELPARVDSSDSNRILVNLQSLKKV